MNENHSKKKTEVRSVESERESEREREKNREKAESGIVRNGLRDHN